MPKQDAKIRNNVKRCLPSLVAVFFLTLAIAAGGTPAEEDAKKPPEPTWFYLAKTALPIAKQTGRPTLLTLGYAGDIPSWELRQSVFETDEFKAVAGNFLLCRNWLKRDDLKALGLEVASNDLGAIIFLSPDGEEMERVRWTGEPGLTLSVIKRVAAGNSVAQLRAKISKAPGDVESLKMLYDAHAAKREAGPALEMLELLKSADAENRKRYEALAGYWGVALLMEKRQWAEALKEIETALPDMDDPALHDDLVVRRAGIVRETGKKAEAISQLKEFISANAESPALEKAYRELITMLLLSGRIGDGVALAAEAVRALPGSRTAAQTAFNIAFQLYQGRAYKESKELLELIAGTTRGLASAEQADILYRAMEYGADWKRRLARGRKILDVLYIVPDTATLLYYVSLWDEETFFPVLVNSGSERDRRLIQKFAAAFKPSRIVAAPHRNAKIDEATAWKAVLTSWNADDLDGEAEANPKAIRKELERLNIAPMGIVFTDPGDEGFLAGGVALAAGRFELLDFYRTAGKISDEIDAAAVRALRGDLEKKIEAWGYQYGRAFDDVDFVTFALDMPLKFKARDFHLYCVDDFVTRREDEIRYAWPGRLMEGVTGANYMAMCSLFLQPEKALFFNTYSASADGFADYRTAGAAERMKRMMPAANFEGNDASLKQWRSLMGRVNTFGYVHVNSSGGKDQWNAAGGMGEVADIPAESVACIVQMTHSYSAAEPWDSATIAGRWLRAGAYIYFGSTYEPFLQSFRAPSRMAAAMDESEPLSMAYRQGFGELYWIPWRLCYFGDPMFLLTGKRQPRASAENLKLREQEKEAKNMDEILSEKE